MTEPVVRVLLVEDDEDDYLLTRDLLADIEGRRYLVEWVSDCDAARQALCEQRFDVCLVDYRLVGCNGLELVRETVAANCPAPLILLTGLADRTVDVEAMRAGAADFLVKDRIDAPMLERAIRYALERKRAENELRQLHGELEQRVRERTAALAEANEQLAENDRVKDLFLATLAHELRNPLAPIINALTIMRRRDPGDADLCWARDVIDRQVRQLTRLVDDLLDVSRITTGKIQLRKERVELAAVVARAVETSQPLIEAGRHQLAVTLPARPVWLDADPTRLAQVLSNLLNNAAKYSEPGGRITLTAEREGPGGNPTDAVVLRVKDTGMGITRDMLPRIFGLFTQVAHSQPNSQGGLGIGLSLVRSLVQLHSGSVSAASEGPGKGSEFVVRLPLVREAELAAPGRTTAKPTVAAGGVRVLVVDDNVDAAQSMARLLRARGHEVSVVHDGRAALEAGSLAPEVVLLDIGLPGLDGHEVARQLRQNALTKGVVLIAMTGYGQEEDRRRSHEAGFDHHLVKPVDPDEVEKLLAGVRSRSEG